MLLRRTVVLISMLLTLRGELQVKSALMRSMSINHEGRNIEIRDLDRNDVSRSSHPVPEQLLGRNLYDLGIKLFGLRGLDKVLEKTRDPLTIKCTDLSTSKKVELKFVRDVHSERLKNFESDICSDPYLVVEGLKKKRGLMVDIGANVGQEAILAMKVHPDLRVIALEPQPTAYFYMRWNMRLNGIPLLSQSELSDPDKPAGTLE